MRRAAWGLETEKGFLAAVVALAKVQGWRCFHPYLSVHSTPGFPDLVLAKGPHGSARGRLLVVECKSERGKLTPPQVEWISLLQAIEGIECYVWRPSSWPEIERILGHH